jgi:hypothetical protein
MADLSSTLGGFGARPASAKMQSPIRKTLKANKTRCVAQVAQPFIAFLKHLVQAPVPQTNTHTHPET